MKHNKFFTVLLAAIVMLSSCKKDLDLQPTDTFNDANAFVTFADVQQGANGAYARYGNAYLNDIYVNALLSDEAKLGLDNAGQGALTYRFQFSADPTTGGDVVSAWGDYYAVIDQINRVLPKIATVTATADQEPRRNIVKGQLLALRGIAHFGLLQAYSKNYNPADPLGIPVLLESNPLAKPSRNTVGETMDRIIADLAEAKSLLPAVTPATFTDTVMNRVNIAAYQARIALYRNDYDAAVAFATEVINSNVKPIVSGTDFSGIWSDLNTNEVLFRIRYATSTALGDLWNTVNGQIYIASSDKLVNSYSLSDIRGEVFVGTLASGDNYVAKYLGSTRGANVNDLKAIRIAEMYLIRAEAYAKKASPDLVGGAADLNIVRQNRIDGYVDQTFASAPLLITAVLQERYKELAFEGHRFYDLKRNNLSVERLSSDANAAWQTLTSGDYKFVLPVPREELNANPNMVQNSGY